MEKQDEQRDTIGSESVESTTNNSNSFADFVANDSDATSDNPTTDDARSKKEKEDRYFDDKENPRTHYNVNDQAHSQSSKDDFVKTVSNFRHDDGHTEADNDYPEQVPD